MTVLLGDDLLPLSDIEVMALVPNSEMAAKRVVVLKPRVVALASEIPVFARNLENNSVGGQGSSFLDQEVAVHADFFPSERHYEDTGSLRSKMSSKVYPHTQQTALILAQTTRGDKGKPPDKSATYPGALNLHVHMCYKRLLRQSASVPDSQPLSVTLVMVSKTDLRLLGLLIASMTLIGCGSLQQLHEAKETGTSVVYPVDSQQARVIVRAILQYEDATVPIHEPAGSSFLYARISNWAGELGQKDWVGVWIEDAGKGSTKVTVVTKRHSPLAVPIALREETFHEMFAKAVPIVAKGQPIPINLWSREEKTHM